MDEDKIIQKLIMHDDEFAEIKRTMATKDDIRDIRTILEVLVTEVKKIREDHAFAMEWMKRLQSQVDRQEEEIRQIKLKLAMV